MSLRERTPRTGSASAGWLQLLRSLREIPWLAHHNPESTAFMRYRAAQAGAASESRPTRWVPLHDVSPYLVCAIFWAEDSFFLEHRGINWRRIREAIRSARQERRSVRAVSTITQQLARNLFLHPERSMKRKVQEAILARRMEQVLTKERILELYLNVVEWGEGVWGIGCAAQEHFSRTPAELDPFQGVVLATMLPAPRHPLRDRNAKRAIAAQKSVATRLYGSGILSRDETVELWKRIQELERVIEEGGSAEDVLRGSSARPFRHTSEDRPEITTQRLISSGFGATRWRRLVPVFREAAKEKRRPVLPMWWTGEPAPALAAHAAGEAAAFGS